MAETIIVGVIIALAAAYAGYRLFAGRSCGCGCGCGAADPKGGARGGGCCGKASGGCACGK